MQSKKLIDPNDHENYLYYAVQLKNSVTKQLSSTELHQNALSLSKSLDFHFVDRIGELKDCFLFAKPKISTELIHHHHLKRLEQHSSLEWVEQQIPNRRLVKRIAPVIDDFIALGINDPGFKNQWHLV